MNSQVILVTGASRGIGKEIAYQFSRQGASLFLTYNLNGTECQNVAKKCLDYGSPRVEICQLDLSDDASIRNLRDKVISTFGYINILVNNAGVLIQKPLQEQSFKDISQQMRVNLEGLIKVTSIITPTAKGIIINIGSTLATIGKRSLTVYCSTKFGVRGFSKALAKELSSVKTILVNPGLTSTDMGSLQGMKASRVAKTIADVVSGRLSVNSGDEIDMHDLRFGYKLKNIYRLLRKIKSFLSR